MIQIYTKFLFILFCSSSLFWLLPLSSFLPTPDLPTTNHLMVISRAMMSPPTTSIPTTSMMITLVPNSMPTSTGMATPPMAPTLLIFPMVALRPWPTMLLMVTLVLLPMFSTLAMPITTTTPLLALMLPGPLTRLPALPIMLLAILTIPKKMQ